MTAVGVLMFLLFLGIALMPETAAQKAAAKRREAARPPPSP